MSLATVCMSHSPLLEFAEPPAEVVESVQGAFDRVRTFVKDYDPDLVINFAPDHYNGFFYDLMPPFCIGYEAVSVGDYGSQAGPLDVPTEMAEELAQFVIDQDVDMAISRRMEVDHGAVQPMEIIYGDITAKPVIPVFVNGVAKPFTSMRRVRQMGQAIGDYLKALDQKVLIIGSGGLSHDPPVPQWATADEGARKLLLNGRHPTAEARNARQQRVIDTAKSFAAGTATIRDLNPQWDQQFMADCASGEAERFDGYDVSQMALDAGNSAHEVRTWVSAFSALGRAGSYEVTYDFYRPIREYIAGFGVMIAQQR